MDRVYQANAIETPPSTTASSGSYPTAGNKASGQLATVPGPYWFYSITEEIRNALIKAGVTPDGSKVNQLADALGKYLPLSGGTMNGTIRVVNGDSITANNNANYVNVCGGVGANEGARITLSGKDRDTDAGVVKLVANNGTQNSSFLVYPDGATKVNNKDVITSAGGTVDGLFTMSGDVIKNKDATSWMAFFGGTNVNDGAGLELSGGSRSGSTGQFILRAKIDNNNVCQLNGRPNGELYWGGKRVITEAAPLVPNYSSGVAISSDTYTAPAAGIVILICMGNPRGESRIEINGIQVSEFNNGADHVDRTDFAFVNKGDVVTFVTKGSSVSRKFYPLKVGG